MATWDDKKERLAIVVVNYRDRYSLRRDIEVQVEALPEALRGGEWREWIVDVTHSNVWHDRRRAELESTSSFFPVAYESPWFSIACTAFFISRPTRCLVT